MNFFKKIFYLLRGITIREILITDGPDKNHWEEIKKFTYKIDKKGDNILVNDFLDKDCWYRVLDFPFTILDGKLYQKLTTIGQKYRNNITMHCEYLDSLLSITIHEWELLNQSNKTIETLQGETRLEKNEYFHLTYSFEYDLEAKKGNGFLLMKSEKEERKVNPLL